MEDAGSTGSEFDALVDAGIEVYSHVGISGQLHHKYCIVDHSEPLSDPTVVTGSHNWSTTAETTNDENTLVIHDERIANLYFQEFTGLLNAMGVGVNELATSKILCRIFPNPADSRISIQITDLQSIGQNLILRDASGRIVLSEQINSMTQDVVIGQLSAGIYLAQFGNSKPTQLVVR